MSLVITIAALLLLIGYMNQPRCRCPYRRRLFLRPDHKVTTAQILLAGCWSLLLLNDFLRVDRDLFGPWWLRLLNAVFVAIAAFYVTCSLGAIYYHEYPRIRRLKAKVSR